MTLAQKCSDKGVIKIKTSGIPHDLLEEMVDYLIGSDVYPCGDCNKFYYANALIVTPDPVILQRCTTCHRKHIKEEV